MNAESNTMPQHQFVIDRRGELADVTFFENVIESESLEGKTWKYETYSLTIPYRNDLASLIEEQHRLWLEKAKSQERPNSKEPTAEERLAVLEKAMLEVVLGG